jgi:hypothetical protein
MAEDRLLCKTWLIIGMDPTTSTDRTRETYWMRMKEYFDVNNTSGNVRTIRSLRSRWSIINTDCQKWVGVQGGVDEINPSGTNDMDRVSYSITIAHLYTCLLFHMTHFLSFIYYVEYHCSRHV